MLTIDEFYKINSFKKYYEFYEDISVNYIENLFLSKDSNLLCLIEIKYDRQEVCATINRWIDKQNSYYKSQWFGFAHNDIKHITIDMNIVESFHSINHLLLDKINTLNNEETISYIFIYCGFELYYENFCNETIYNQTKINEFYRGKLRDNDFIKWNLISISDNRKFVDDRIFDFENEKTIHLSLKRELLDVFHKMIDDGSIKKISIRSNDRIQDGIIKNDILCEGVAKGEIFNFAHLNICKETILFSDFNYYNQLWVFADSNNIIFEELLDDFQVDQKTIVTQMIHIEFFFDKETKLPYISHIDKENIFYTEKEYEERLRNNTKGNAKKREKFFKINDSKIRFDYPCDIIDISCIKKPKETSIPFIYFIVRHFFKNKDVIDEYFSKL